MSNRRHVIVRVPDEVIRRRLDLPGPVVDARVAHFGSGKLELVVEDPDGPLIHEDAEPMVVRWRVDGADPVGDRAELAALRGAILRYRDTRLLYESAVEQVADTGGRDGVLVDEMARALVAARDAERELWALADAD